MLMYGRGIASIAEQIKDHDGPVSPEDIRDAKRIQDSFFNGFPKVKKWMDQTLEDARNNGYVEDAWGRRRRLPDLNLPKIEAHFANSNRIIDFNPLLGSKGLYNDSDNDTLNYYVSQGYKCKSRKAIEDLKIKALSAGVIVKDNTGFISQAERQCVNARIQGGAASMSKRAMIAIYNNQELKDLGYRMLIIVHDEIIGECPEENQERVKELISQLMIEAAKPECTVPMKCDADSFHSWYEDVYTSNLREEYEHLLENHPLDKTLEIICKNHEECSYEQILTMLNNN